MILGWLTAKTYNRFDLLWFAIATSAWYNRQYFTSITIVIVGAFLSGILEAWSKPQEKAP
jgi:hypothetical protein